MTIIILIVAAFWLVISSILFSAFADIAPKDRKVTRKLWFRSLMVAGGPLTAVVAIIIGLSLLAVEFIVESVQVDIPDALRSFFTKTPTVEE